MKPDSVLRGIGVSPGIAFGQASLFDKHPQGKTGGAVRPASALDSAIAAVRAAKDRIQAAAAEARERDAAEEAAILEAQALILEDPDLLADLVRLAASGEMNADDAVRTCFNKYAAILSGQEDGYMRERAADIRGLARMVLASLESETTVCSLNGIVIARELGPADTAGAKKDTIDGFVLAHGGATSHAAIMARSMGIPMVAGIGSGVENIREGDSIIVDGNDGAVVICPSQSTITAFREKRTHYLRLLEGRESLRRRPSETQDGRVIELWANIGKPEEATQALKAGAAGIGLFRTEFLYMRQNTLPGEEEQMTAYAETLRAMDGRPVVVRTLDIGGDKKLAALPLPEESNPFLGVRGTRLCMEHRDVFRAQLRALLRASVHGQLWIMLPMIATLDEFSEAKRFVNDVRRELRAESLEVSPSVKLGVMIEVPAAAICADRLAAEADFFSIGSNDLIQYAMAADRQSERVRYLYQPCHEAIRRLIEMTVNAGRRAGIPVSLCGEMAGDPACTQMLVGLGLEKLSMVSRSILPVKEQVLMSNYEHLKAEWGRQSDQMSR